MADQDPDIKLVIKAGVCKEYLSEFRLTDDGESFQFGTLALANKRIEQVNKAVEEVKDVIEIQLENNGLADCKPLEMMTKLVKLNLANNKIKSMNIFTGEDAFPNLKWLDV